MFTFASVAGATALALAFASAVLEFVSAGASTALDNTDVFPLRAGIDISSADSMKIVAAAIVIFDKTLAVPRGPKAALETLLVNNAPASVLPGWSNTAPTNTMQEVKNNAYKTYINL